MDGQHGTGGTAGPVTVLSGSAKIKHLTGTVYEGQSRFPKLNECAHFHYEYVELRTIEVSLYDECQESVKSVSNGEHVSKSGDHHFCVQVTSAGKTWIVRRTYDNFYLLDQQLHQCIYDRKFSSLPPLPKERLEEQDNESEQNSTKVLLEDYLIRFSVIAGNLINCGPVLNWLELDNRGNRLIVTDDSAINTPAVAAAYVVKRYTALAPDEISFEVGDMISVIDMPPPEDSIWWRGKKGFEVGFFPCECVEVIGSKVPRSINIPRAPTKPVLRKHGKLISFFRAFILSRPSRRKLKQRGILKERVFGCDLGEHLNNIEKEIPMVLKCCAEFIEESGIVDGIYRLSGITSNIQKLRNAFDEDRVPNLRDPLILQDIHCVASLLKMYFRELPNPLLTYQLYDKFVAAVQSDESERLLNMRDVVQQLPPPHYRTLEYLVLHLARVASHGAETGMTPKNVAIVWAPNLLRSKELELGSVAALQVVGVQAIVTEYLIRYVELIFNEKLPIFLTSVGSSGTPRKIRPKSLAISTPTKLLSLEEARFRALSAGSQSQPQYIEVGGGPANLPAKYHTVIDLPDRKRGSTKLKKSPSGWKSFFSKNKSFSHGKEKSIAQRKISSPIMSTSLGTAERAFTESDVTRNRGKRLRSVKSAESLISSGGNASQRNSEILDLGSDLLDSAAPKPGMSRVAFDLSSSLPTPSKMSPHTHVRSVSHDSYFEMSPDLGGRDSSETVASDPTKNSLETDNKSEQLILDDFEDVATDMNYIHVTYDDLDLVSTGSEPLEDSDSVGKSPKKHRWKPSGSLSSKSNLSLKEKLKQAFTSPPQNRKTNSSGSDASEESSLRGSLKRTPSSLKEKIYSALSPESLRRRQATGAESATVVSVGGGVSHAAQKTDTVVTFQESCFISPEKSPESVDGTKEEPKTSDCLSPDEDEIIILGDKPMGKETTASLPDGNNKVVVERYGSEKTIIVEVHATQESEEDEQVNDDHAKEREGKVVVDQVVNPLWFPAKDMVDPSSHSPISYHSSVQGEYGSPASAVATVSDDESFYALDMLYAQDMAQATESHPEAKVSAFTDLLGDGVVFAEDIGTTAEQDKVALVTESGDLCTNGTTHSEEGNNIPDVGEGEGIKSTDIQLEQESTTDDWNTGRTELDDLPTLLSFAQSAEKPDSEASTPSVATPGDVVNSGSKDPKYNFFGYSVLVNEPDGGSSVGEESPDTGPSEGDVASAVATPASSAATPSSAVVTPAGGVSVVSSPGGTLCMPPGALVFSEWQMASQGGETCTDAESCESQQEESPTDYEEPKDTLEMGYNNDSDLMSPVFYERPPVSPMDENKRRFESEIGRDILHERKVRQELEKIQCEHRSSDGLSRVEPAPCPRSLPSPLDVVCTSRFIQVEPTSEGVELRRSHTISGTLETIITANAENTKRNSEPISSSTRNEVSDRKRLSEPSRVPSEKKASVRQMLSKFESPCQSEMGPAPPKMKCVRPASSPVISDQVKPTDVPVEMRRSSLVTSKPPTPPPPMSAKAGTAVVRMQCRVGNDGKNTVTVRSREKLALRLSAPLDLIHSQTESGDASSQDMDDAARRERIDKYKEERRAQLREKIRSESFKMDKEERTEYLSRLRGKGTSPTHSREFDQGKKVSPPPARERGSVGRTSPRSPKHSSSFRVPKDDPFRDRTYSESRVTWCPLDDTSAASGFLRSDPGRRSLRTGSESEALDMLRREARIPEKPPFRRRGSLAKDSSPVSPTKPKELSLWDSSNRPCSPATKGKPRSPVDGGATSPPPRRIRQVMALFEKDTNVTGPSLPVHQTRDFLSRSADERTLSGNGKSEVRKKASQYLSAV